VISTNHKSLRPSITVAKKSTKLVFHVHGVLLHPTERERERDRDGTISEQSSTVDAKAIHAVSPSAK